MGPGRTFCRSPKCPWRLGFAGLECWDVGGGLGVENVQSPARSRSTGWQNKLTASLPSDATWGPVQTFAGILLREA